MLDLKRALSILYKTFINGLLLRDIPLVDTPAAKSPKMTTDVKMLNISMAKTHNTASRKLSEFAAGGNACVSQSNCLSCITDSTGAS